MPMYEYECNECGEKFEMRRGFSDSDEDITCPKCGVQNVKRAMSLFASGGGGGGGAACTPAPSGIG
ncbi:MAG: zinc ribbon domain-containing protein [Dehalococcoidia bacterium]